MYAPDRLLHPLKRTRPQGDPDPGWVRITRDEALDWTAARMREAAGREGPQAVAFAVTTPSGTAVSNGFAWIERLIRFFGSPNAKVAFGFGRGFGTGRDDRTERPPEEGAGGEGGVATRPVGVIEITPAGTRFIAIHDTRRLAGVFCLGLALGLALRRRRPRV